MWFRKSVVHLLSLVLLFTLLGTAVATSANISLSKPKVEQGLEQSKLYDNFAAFITEQAQKSAGGAESAGPSVKSYPALKQSADANFSPELLKKSVTSFLDSNYAWLEGKTPQPKFAVDLTQAKQTFAEQAGRYVKDRLASLPVCTPAQLALLPDPSNIDPLSIDCRPATLTPEEAGTTVTQQIASSDEFLSDPVVTAETINPKDANDQGQPYYVKLAKAPQAYQLGQKLPYIFAAMALLAAASIIFTHPDHRKGWRRVGIVLLIAGALLLVGKLLSDYLFKKLEHRLFNNAGIGQIQHSLVDFTHRTESQMTKIDIYFAAAFLVLAAIILLYLRRSRPPKRYFPTAPPQSGTPATQNSKPVSNAPPPDVTGSAGKPTSAPQLKPKSRKPPRLIQ